MSKFEGRAAAETLAFNNQELFKDAAFTKYNNTLPRDSFDLPFAQELLRLTRGKKRDRNTVRARGETFRGHTPKEEQIASLRVITNLSAQARSVVGQKKKTGAFLVFGTDQFLLQQVSEQDVERYQIVETFGEPIAFFYGRKPRIYNYGGVLFNSGFRFDGAGKDFFSGSNAFTANTMLWRDNFKLAYDLFLRGTKCVRFRARVYLNYDRVLREGFILNNQITQSVHPNMVNFGFTMFVTREVNLDGIEALAKNTLDGKPFPASPADATKAAVQKQIDSNLQDELLQSRGIS